MTKSTSLSFGPYSVELSHPDKLLFPKANLSKKEVVKYYQNVADPFLRHAKNRPLAMHRYPEGIAEKDFFQKEVPDYFPEWIERCSVERKSADAIPMLIADKKATLAYLVQQGSIAQHLFLSRCANLQQPDKLLFDLDPPEDGFDLVLRAAKQLRRHLREQHGLKSFVMTTGSSGLHVVVPLQPGPSYEEVRSLAKQIAEELAEAQPNAFTTEQRKAQRDGRLFLDVLRNSHGQHSIAPYSLRALPHAPVATPLHWEELDELPNQSQSFHFFNIQERLEKLGDPWEDLYQHAQQLG